MYRIEKIWRIAEQNVRRTHGAVDEVREVAEQVGGEVRDLVHLTHATHGDPLVGVRLVGRGGDGEPERLLSHSTEPRRTTVQSTRDQRTNRRTVTDQRRNVRSNVRPSGHETNGPTDGPSRTNGVTYGPTYGPVDMRPTDQQTDRHGPTA